jgi:hypothetical protein
LTLILNKLGNQLEQMGQETASREDEYRKLYARAVALLQEHSAAYQTLAERARLAAEQKRWRGAIPLEPLLTQHALPPHPPQATLIGADGSQIEPDRHGAALYALVNVGHITFEHGTGNRPLADSEPRLYYTDADLHEDKRLLQGNLLDIRRDSAELSKLAELAGAAAQRPVLALSDGTLLLWVLEEHPAARKQARLKQYIESLERLRRLPDAAVAAFTSRPRHAEVVDLLHLASLGEDPDWSKLEDNDLAGLLDRAVFDFLQPGERSALFISAVPINAEYRRLRPEQEIGFFYMNVGDQQNTEVARIELPYWAMKKKTGCQPEVGGKYSLLDFVQAAIYAQCQMPPHGYPYILARAHELALVSMEEQRDLDLRIATAMARHGISVRPSEKARLKELTGGGKRRHRL